MQGRRSRLAAGVPPLILLGVGVVMLVWTWGAWLHPVIDFGRELYVPWQITEGKVLFRDLAWFNGPLSQYINAGLFSVFGVGLRTLVVGNVVFLAGVLVVLYHWIAGVSDRLTATVATGLAIFLFGFSQLDQVPNFNWVCPYSHELTHGVGLSILTLFLLTRWLRRPALVPLGIAGLAAGLVVLTKPEVLLALLLAVAATFGLAWSARPRDPGRLLRHAAVFAGLALIAPLLAFGLLASAMPAGQAWRGVLGGWAHVFDARISALAFYRSGLGTDDPSSRLQAIAQWTGWWMLVIAPPVVVCLLLRRPFRWRPVLAWALAGSVFALFYRPTILWAYAYTPLPFVCLFLAAVAAWQFWQNRGDPRAREGPATRLVMLVLATALLAKIALNARVHHYGFALSMLAVTVCVTALLAWLPARVSAAGGYGTGVRIASSGILLIVVVGSARIFALRIERNTHVVSAGVDAFRADRVRGPVLDVVVKTLRRLEQKTTLVVLPEGVMLNYLARVVNPTRFVSFMPPEVLMFGEDRMLEALRAGAPDAIVLVNRTTEEYGLPLFGRDYGQRIRRWVGENYRPLEEAKFGREPLVPARLADSAWSLWVLARRE